MLAAPVSRKMASTLRYGNQVTTLLRATSCVLHCPSASVSYLQDGKGGYIKKDDMTRRDHAKEGMKHLRGEVGVFKEEVLKKFRCDSIIPIQHGDYEIPWNFHGTDEYTKWIVSADHDHGEGFSSAHFTQSKNNNGLFYGNLSTRIPKDGIVARSGYCNIRSPRKTISFKRFTSHDWTDFTHLLICCRGDGRTYAINIIVDTYFDVNQYDQYNYFLYTHGGPYWQTAKIPFSKFMLTSNGRIQDKQAPIPRDRVTTVGLTMADDIDGPFQLEISHIGVTLDQSHNDEFAYETYSCDPSALAHW